MNCQPSTAVDVAELLDLVDTALATIARRLPPHIGRDDLASVGKLALIEAAAQCDGTLDELRAYCFVRVRGAMLDELRRLDPLSRQQRERVQRVTRAIATLPAILGRPATTEEIAGATGLSAREVAVAQRVIASTENPDLFDWDSLADENALTPAQNTETRDLHSQLHSALDRLPTNQRVALRRYYLDDATLDEIAIELGVSRERARQIRDAGEKRLRADFAVLAAWQALLSSK